MKSKTALVCTFSCTVLFVLIPTMLPRRAGAFFAAQESTPAKDFSAFVYDVVSIKPYKKDPNATSEFMGSQETPDGFTGTNIPLSILLFTAHRTEHSRISGAPSWMNNERYDVEAKMDPDVAEALHKLGPEDQKLARKHMMEEVLKDRMKVAVHMETTEVPIYELVIAKSGIKMKETTDPNAPDGGLRVSGAGGGAFQWQGQGVKIDGMLGQLSYAAGRPVYDKTGLTGKYAFTLKYTPERVLSAAATATAAAPALDTAPPLAQAMEEQLGLKLVSAKGAMDVIVIDHVERPSAN